MLSHQWFWFNIRFLLFTHFIRLYLNLHWSYLKFDNNICYACLSTMKNVNEFNRCFSNDPLNFSHYILDQYRSTVTRFTKKKKQVKMQNNEIPNKIYMKKKGEKLFYISICCMTNTNIENAVRKEWKICEKWKSRAISLASIYLFHERKLNHFYKLSGNFLILKRELLIHSSTFFFLLFHSFFFHFLSLFPKVIFYVYSSTFFQKWKEHKSIILKLDVSFCYLCA